MAGVTLRGTPPYGFSAPVVVISRLNDASYDPLPPKNVNPAVIWFSGFVPLHESAVLTLKDLKITPLKAVVLNETRDLGLDESDLNVREIRRFLMSKAAAESGLTNVVTALEFNAKLADRTVSIPAIFEKDHIPAGSTNARFLAGKKWWSIDFIGISERHTATLPVEYRLSANSHIRAAERIVRTAEKFSSDITIRTDDEGSRQISAKSLLGVLSLGICPGREVTIEAEGPDAKQAVGSLTRRIRAFKIVSAKAEKPNK